MNKRLGGMQRGVGFPSSHHVIELIFRLPDWLLQCAYPRASSGHQVAS